MIITLTGSNSFGLQAELNWLVAEFVKKHGETGVERLDGEEAEFERLREGLQSLPFLASRKLVVLKNPSASKQFVEAAEQLLSDLPDNTDVILVEPKVDRRTAYYKFLKAATDFHEFGELDSPELARWLIETAKNQQASLSFGDAKYLIERVGSNQQLVSNELLKLIDYDPDITRQTIDLLTEQSPQSTIFELIDAALTGKPKRMLELYEQQRRQKVEPQQILAMIGWQLHALALVKTAGQRDAATIAREAKLNPFVVRKSLGIARQISLTQLKRLINDAVELDLKLKTQSIDADEALQHFLLTLSS